MLALKHRNVTFQITFPTCSPTFHLGEPRNGPDGAREWLLRLMCGQGHLVTELTPGHRIPRDPRLWSWETPPPRGLGHPGHDSVDWEAADPEIGWDRGHTARRRTVPNPGSLSFSISTSVSKNSLSRTSLAVQWLRLGTSTAGGSGTTPRLRKLRSCLPHPAAKKRKINK